MGSSTDSQEISAKMVSSTDSQDVRSGDPDRGKGKAIAVSQQSVPHRTIAPSSYPCHSVPHYLPHLADLPANEVEKITAELEGNSFRLMLVTNKLEAVLQGRGSSGSNELQKLISNLGKGMDYALSHDHVPTSVLRLPPVIKQVYPYRNDSSLQQEIWFLMIQAKNACMNGWFYGKDATELLTMANKICNNFCLEVGLTPDAGGIISKIMPRFYPKIILKNVIVAFGAKHGYDVRMEVFHVGRNLLPHDRIVLFVVQTDNLETSSCLINPPQVSFLVNGKRVEKRCHTLQDNGPQLPTDISNIIKFGTNIIQALGYYNNTCLIAIAVVQHVASLEASILEDYVQPSFSELASDSELVEGPSRITLNCPISFRHINTPVKGQLCKHRQCFDYENFMEINLRKPFWRCPCCNQSTTFVDLRIDQKMAKIIGEAGHEIADVIIFPDGSWKKVGKTTRSNNQLCVGGTSASHQDSSAECQFYSSSSTPIDVVDLTTKDARGSITNGSADRTDNVTSNPEYRKPFPNRDNQDQLQYWGAVLQAQQASQTGTVLNMPEQTSRVNMTSGTVEALNPSMRNPEDIILSVSESITSQTTAGLSGSDGLQAAEWMEEQPNWRAATGRMKGSLSGSAYEAVLNQYLAPSTTAKTEQDDEGSQTGL